MRKTLLAAIFASACVSAADNAVLWKDPGPVESLDFAAGPGGREKAPRAPFIFESEDMGGTAPKVSVKDARNNVWTVKFGPEVKAETFATRLAWAAGYLAEPTYYLAEGTIGKVGNLKRAAEYIVDGRFREARFELRDANIYRFVPDSSWRLDEKSLKNSKELTGLKLVLMLTSNWDVKPGNMAIIEVNGQRYYAVTDWGATMGQAGDMSGRSKWNCQHYATQSEHFVHGVDDGYLSFNHGGKASGMVSSGIRVDDVKWFMNRMGKLTDAQIRSGLQASGASPGDEACFTKALRQRLDQLTAAASGTPASGGAVIRTRTTTSTGTTTQPER